MNLWLYIHVVLEDWEDLSETCRLLNCWLLWLLWIFQILNCLTNLVLVNIIITKLERERVIVEPSITSCKNRFYIRYVDDTLLLAKKDIMLIFVKFNSFHKNLKFTIDRFDNNNRQFLNIAIKKDNNRKNWFILQTHSYWSVFWH